MSEIVVTRRTLVDDILLGFLDWRANLGPEKVTNGSFTGNADGWTLGAGWTYNANAVDRDGAGTATLSQDVSSVAKELYKVVFEITAYTDGSVTPSIGGVSGSAVSAAGTSTQYILATGTGVLAFTPTANATFTLDNVSVKKVGYVNADGVTLWIDDRGATAGKGALHMMTEDGTGYVFGDRMGFGTFNPGNAYEMLGNLLINIGGYAATITHAITAARTLTLADASHTSAGQNIDNAFSVAQTFAAGIIVTTGQVIKPNVDTGLLQLQGDTSGASALQMYGKTHATLPGSVRLYTPDSAGSAIQRFILGSGGALPAVGAYIELSWNLVHHTDMRFKNGAVLSCAAANEAILELRGRNAADGTQAVAKIQSMTTVADSIFSIYAQAAIPTTTALAAGHSWIKYNAAGTAVLYVNDAGVIKSLSLGTPA